jgi:O-antigen biosynthesis protein WbqP
MLNRLVAQFFLVILSPIFFIVVLVILIKDGFPVFFTQSRVGNNYTFFYIFKFRTMKMNIPNFATHLFTNPGQYVLKIGEFIHN